MPTLRSRHCIAAAKHTGLESMRYYGRGSSQARLAHVGTAARKPAPGAGEKSKKLDAPNSACSALRQNYRRAVHHLQEVCSTTAIRVICEKCGLAA
jgi:hypothetical protein